jgi:hypothetical protein
VLPWESYGDVKYTVWTKCRDFDCYFACCSGMYSYHSGSKGTVNFYLSKSLLLQHLRQVSALCCGFHGNLHERASQFHCKNSFATIDWTIFFLPFDLRFWSLIFCSGVYVLVQKKSKRVRVNLWDENSFVCFSSNDGRRENKYVSLYHFCTLNIEVLNVRALRIFRYW